MLLCPNFWAPLVEFSFRPIDDFRSRHTRNGKNKHADKDLIGLEGCAGHRDHEADASSSGVKLSHHNADEGPPDRQP